jgi:hypothetical protein
MDVRNIALGKGNIKVYFNSTVVINKQFHYLGTV